MEQTPDSPAAPPPKTPKALQRASTRFISDPSSARNAIYLIVAADILVVLFGGFLIWTLDRAEFEDVTTAFWYILQTVTTVGYGDVTPVEPIGRLIGAVVMLLGIATLSILTAGITSSFIEARQAARHVDDQEADDARWDALDARIDAIMARLDQLDGAKPGADDART